jgi:hypothetical protein
MSLQFGTTLRNNFLGQIGSTIGSSATLTIYTGSPPANCGTAASGTLLATETLSATPFAAASGGSVSMNGLPITANAGNTGTAGYFRILDGSSVCHMQGTCGLSGTDMIFDNTSLVSGQAVNITGFTITAPGA